MSQYLLSVIHDDELQAVFAAVDSFNAKLQAEGAWVFAGGLQTHEATTTVDATLRWAAEGSKACANRVEARPFQEEPSQEKQGA